MTQADFTNTLVMMRLVLRRDRTRLAVWVLAITGLVLMSASSVQGLYDTPESLAAYARLVKDNAALIVQAGPGFGLDDPTVGAVLMNELSIWAIIVVALLSLFTVTRHTRAEEESERADVVRSTPLGRDANAAATMLAVLLVDLVVAGAVAIGLVGFGLSVAGSVAFGASLVGAGLVFASITLVAAQIFPTARATSGSAFLVLGVSFVIRAVGDVAGNGLSWLSPIGWAQAVRPCADERWWVLLLPIAASFVLVALSAGLAGRRDLGAGLLPQRVGPASAGAHLSTPFGLAVRLHRASVLGWATGVTLLSFFYGVVAEQAQRMLDDNPDLADFFAQLGTGSITDAFLATAVTMTALLVGGYAVSAVLRLRTEEAGGRADSLLATPTSRARWALSHLAVAMIAVVGLLVVAGLALGLGAAVAMRDAGRVVQLTGATLAMAPAAALLAAIAFLFAAAWPRAVLASWLGVGAAAVIALLGGVLDLPDSVKGLSPFHHIPAMPVQPFDVAPLLVLAAMAALAIAVGLSGLRRRDVART